MIWPALFDPSFSSRLCLTLQHSLWQMALLASLTWLVCLPLRKRSVEFEYALHLGALLAAMLALPITFNMVEVPKVDFAVRIAAPVKSASTLISPSFGEAALADPIEVPAEIWTSESRAPRMTFSPAGSSDQWSMWLKLTPWLAGLYFVGVLIMLMRLGIAIVRAERLRSQAHAVTTGRLVESLSIFSRQWSLRVVPVLARVESIALPKVIGLLRPMILFPASALAGLSAKDLEMILIHELAHVRRYDLWGNLLQRLMEVILFFNPAAWYLSGKLSMLREYCCDDMTCRALSGTEAEQRLQYVTTLLRMVELTVPEKVRHGALTTLAIGGRSPSELRRRVARILGEPLRDPIRISRGGALAFATAAVLAVYGPMLTRTNAQTIDPNAETIKSLKKVADELNDIARKLSEPSGGTITKTFKFGSKIEVLALGQHDEQSQLWWDAKGRPIATLPFTWKGAGTAVEENGDYRRVVFRIHDYPEDAHINWSIPQSLGSDGGQVIIEGKQPSGYFARSFGVANNCKVAGLKVGVGTGAWTTIVNTTGSSASSGNNLSIVFSEPVQIASETIVIVSHNCFERDFRVVAVDKDGKVHPQTGYGGSSAGQIYQSKAAFPKLARGEIDHFEFQVRDYEWIEFENLPLEPVTAVSLKPVQAQPDGGLTITGRVVDSQSQPIAHAKVWAMQPFFDDWTEIAASDSQGQFQWIVDRMKLDQELKKRPRLNILKLWATAKSYGRVARKFDVHSAEMLAEFILPPEHLIEGQILNAEGQPVPGANIRVVEQDRTDADQVDKYLEGLRHGNGSGIFQPASSRKFVAGPNMPEIVTDQKGQFRIAGLPPERVINLEVEGPGIANDVFGVITRIPPTGSPANGIAFSYPPSQESAFYSRFTYLGIPGKTIRGIVRDKQSGEPLAGMRVMVFGNHSQPQYTDEQGRFEASGFRKMEEFQLDIHSPKLPYFGVHPRIKDILGLDPIAVEINLVRGKTLKGKVIDALTGEPMSGVVEYSALFGNPRVDGMPARVTSPLSQCKISDDGSFEIAFLPGPGVVGARNYSNGGRYLAAMLDRQRVVELIGDKSVEKNDDPMVNYVPIAVGGGAQGAWSSQQYQAVALINPAENETPPEVILEFVTGITRKAKLIGPNGNPVTGAMVMGLELQTSRTIEPLNSAEFSVVSLDPKRRRDVIAFQRELKLAGWSSVDGLTTDPIRIELASCGTVTGRLVDDRGVPRANFAVEAYPVSPRLFNPGWWRGYTDTEGRFRVNGLVPDCPFNLSTSTAKKGTRVVTKDLLVPAGKTKDLGEIVLPNAAN